MLGWEYLIVTCAWRTDRPRYANDQEIVGWDTRDLATRLAEWRAQGWELVDEAPPAWSLPAAAASQGWALATLSLA